MRLQLRPLAGARAAVAVLVVIAAGPSAAEPDPGAPAPPPVDAPPPPPPATTTTTATPAGRRVTGHVRSELSVYADSDHVEVITPSISADAQDAAAGWNVRGEYLVDVVSAASVDIVSTASPNWTEVRQAGSAAGSWKPHDLGVSGVASFSREPDYVAWAAGGTATLDLDQKNFTLLAGYGYGHDLIGRSGTPFSVFSRTLTRNAFNAALTIAAGPATLVVVGGDLILERGDQSKPYRYVPLFSPAVAATIPAGASGDSVNALRLPERPLEQLPLARDRYAGWGRYLHRFPRATLRLEERLYTDSWDMHASSTDARLLLDRGERWQWAAHARFHAQSPVSFWQRAYTLTDAGVPALRTGDRELGPLTAVTAGGGWRWKGGKPNPTGWAIGADLDLTWTSFLDDLYIRNRVGGIATFTWETDL